MMARSTPTPFVILTHQRSGSTWLRDVLDGHPEIAAYNELFLEYGHGFPDAAKYGPTDIEYFESWFREHSSGSRLQRALQAAPYLDTFFAGRGRERAIGFKLMHSQMCRNPAAAIHLARRRVRVIRLVRVNLLDALISSATSAARGQAHAWRGEEIKDVSVILKPRKTVWQLRRIELERAVADRYLSVSRLPAIEVKYEDLVADPTWPKRVFSFLGVDPHWPPKSSMQRLNRSPKEELVGNWGELSDTLRNTRYSRFLAN